MIVVRAGFDSEAVRRWSLPKLHLWLGLCEEAERNFALLQSAAVWDPKSVSGAGERAERQRGERRATESETPLSAEEFKKLVSG